MSPPTLPLGKVGGLQPNIIAVGRLLAYSPITVRKLLGDGRLRGIRLGGTQRWPIRPEDLQAFIEGRKPGGSE